MAVEASRAALEMAGISARDLGLIVLGTVTPDHPMPATATYLQRKIGANGCAAFDLSAACAGFLYGLAIGDKFVSSGQAKYALVIGAELLSRVLNWRDRTTCVLFGDGAGAVVLGPSSGDGRGVVSTHLFADGAGADDLIIPGGGTAEPATHDTIEKARHFVHMSGQAIFSAAVRNLASATRTALESNGLVAEDVDRVVAHQANVRILGALAQRLKMPMDKFFLNIDKYGNTSSASVPIALDEAYRSGAVKDGDLLLMSALGAGLSWGSAVVVM
jgi:3-oxoacyl-[acyl-carrier-protein] synthase III